MMVVCLKVHISLAVGKYCQSLEIIFEFSLTKVRVEFQRYVGAMARWEESRA